MIDTRNSNSSTRVTRMAVGIHTACTVKDAQIKPTTSNKLIEVTIANPSGEIQNYPIWFPRLDNIRPKEGQSEDEAKTEAVNQFTDLALAILRELYPIDQAHTSGNDLDDFANKVVAKLKSATGKVDVAVQWDRNNQYTEFPKYGWIKRHQSGVVPVFDTAKLRLSKDGVTQTSTSSVAKDDLPF